MINLDDEARIVGYLRNESLRDRLWELRSKIQEQLRTVTLQADADLEKAKGLASAPTSKTLYQDELDAAKQADSDFWTFDEMDDLFVALLALARERFAEKL